MVGAADRLVAERAFSRLPRELEQGYLGRDGAGKTMALEPDDAEGSIYARESTFQLLGEAVSVVKSLLEPFAGESFGFEIYSRSAMMATLPFERGEENDYVAPDLQNEDAVAFLTMMWRAKLMVIVNVGPSAATLTLMPKAPRDAEPTVEVRPGTLALFSMDRYKFAYEPKGKALSLLAFFLDRPQAYTVNDISGGISYLVGAEMGPVPPSKDQIPVVSMAARYPFGADEPWKLFFGYAKAAFDTQTKHPYRRWDVDVYYEEGADPMSGRSYTCHGSFTEGVELFDCRFFDIAPGEARGMDPTQRQVLEVSYIALKAAGYSKQGLVARPANIAAFVGLDKNEWRDIPKDLCGGFGASNSANAITANRVNYALNLKGASMTIDTACSSSLVAQHTGKLYLLYRDYDPCEAVVVCGVNLSLSPLSYIGCCAAGMHSHKGRCFTYNYSADGYARGEAVGATCTKHRAWDEAAGDLCLLAGSHVNQDGKSASLTAPNGPAQERCSRAVLKEVGVGPPEIDTTECHGTGTSLGDPIEIGAYRKVMSMVPRTSPVVITTSKSNIGHCEGSAGIGGFLKALLMCTYAEGAPNCHLNRLNAHLDMDGFPGIITTEGVVFKGEASYNSVLSFGFGGTNACATVWGTNLMTSRTVASKSADIVVTRSLQDAPRQHVSMPTDDWEDWELDFPAKDVRPGDRWDVEIDEDGVPLYTRRNKVSDNFGASYFLTGTFNDWEYEEMTADEAVPEMHSAILTVGPEGFEEFQVVADGDPKMTFYPEAPQCARRSAWIRGPGEVQRECTWLLQGVEGEKYRVEFCVSKAHNLSLSWTRDK